MIHLKILDVRRFMEKLLLEDCFDAFLLLEASIRTGNLFSIDGHLNRDFYTEEEFASLTAGEFALTPWKELRHFCYEIIRGDENPFSVSNHLSALPAAHGRVSQPKPGFFFSGRYRRTLFSPEIQRLFSQLHNRNLIPDLLPRQSARPSLGSKNSGFSQPAWRLVQHPFMRDAFCVAFILLALT